MMDSLNPNHTPKEKINQNGLLSVLKINRFRRLWIGQIFSQLADKFYIVLMVYLIAQYWVTNSTESNEAIAEAAAVIKMNFETRAQKITLLATGIYIANVIPAIFIGTFAGIVADRLPKRLVMTASNAFRSFLLLLTPLCLLNGPKFIGLDWGYWALVIMTLLESVLTQFFAPAEQAAIPLLVPRKYLLSANSLYQATSMGATIIGFALGEPILQLLRNLFLSAGINGGEFLLLPFCYAVAAISINSISIKEKINSSEELKLWKEAKEGLNILRKKSTIRNAIIQLVMLYSLLAALYVLSIGLASSIENLGPTKFGILLALSGFGMAIGALALGQIGDRFNRKKLTSTGLSFITSSLLLLGKFHGSLLLTFSLCTLLGIGAALVAIPAQTRLHEETPASMRGKVFGLQNNLTNIAISLPLVLAGGLVSQFGLVPVLQLLAIFALIAIALERPWHHC